MEVSQKKLELKDILINKKVKVVPIKRGNEWLPEGHDGNFLFTDALWSTDLVVDHNTGTRKVIFTKDELTVIEEELNLPKGDMSFYDKDKGFWANNKKGRVILTKEGKTLDLNNIVDLIHYKILKESKHIAPSWKSRFDSGVYKFALVEEEEVTKESNTRYELMKEVYKNLGKIENSAKKMQNVLKLYGKRTNSKDLEFLIAEIQKLIDKDPKKFVEIVTDKNFNTKITIEQALEIRALDRNADKHYILPGGDLVGRTIAEVIEWFENPKNSDIVLTIKAQIENSTIND